jgi:hypothetical protein
MDVDATEITSAQRRSLPGANVGERVSLGLSILATPLKDGQTSIGPISEENATLTSIPITSKSPSGSHTPLFMKSPEALPNPAASSDPSLLSLQTSGFLKLHDLSAFDPEISAQAGLNEWNPANSNVDLALSTPPFPPTSDISVGNTPHLTGLGIKTAKKRVLLDCVLVPTLDQILKRVRVEQRADAVQTTTTPSTKKPQLPLDEDETGSFAYSAALVSGARAFSHSCLQPHSFRRRASSRHLHT